MSKETQEEKETTETHAQDRTTDGPTEIPIKGADESVTDAEAAESAAEAGTPEGPDSEAAEQQPSELDQAREEAAQFKDQWMRSAAELQNVRKRTQREIQEIRVRAGERILRQLLEPVDNLARALAAAEAGTPETVDEAREDKDAVVRGVEMIYGQLMTLLEREQVTLMETVGQPFDPMKHEAMMMVERGDVPEMTIVEEVERGYMLGERPLRHAKVVVSKAPAEGTDAPESGNGTGSENNEN